MHNSPFVVVVTMHLKSGVEEEFFEALQPVLDAMRQETTFVNTVLHRAEEDPRRIMLYETWLDKVDFLVNQIKRPYRDAYWEKLKVLLDEPPIREYFQPLRGDFIFQNGSTQTLHK